MQNIGTRITQRSPASNASAPRFAISPERKMTMRPSFAAPSLQPANSSHRQHPLQDRRQADQHHQQFEKISQPAIPDKLVDRPKTDRADHDDNQNPDEK